MLNTPAKFAVDAGQRATSAIFGELQRGCNTKGGAETIVHEVRSFTRAFTKDAGRCVWTIDFKNAFNTPERASMLAAIARFRSLCCGWAFWVFMLPVHGYQNGVAVTVIRL